MDSLQAIAAAKKHVGEAYADEQPTDLALEEIEHVPGAGVWAVTVAFSRPWKTPRTRAQEVLESLGAVSPARRAYKVVTLDEEGNLLSIKNRRLDAAE